MHRTFFKSRFFHTLLEFKIRHVERVVSKVPSFIQDKSYAYKRSAGYWGQRYSCVWRKKQGGRIKKYRKRDTSRLAGNCRGIIERRD
jgi:hypothetical protein